MRPTCSILMYFSICAALPLFWLLPDYPKVWLPFLLPSVFFAGCAFGSGEIEFDLRKVLRWN